MSQDQHINNFSALDIERYHKGLLSSSEMNQMERAALEDPFFADALEGYAMAGVDAGNDLADLQKKIATRVASESDSRVVPMYRSYTLLKVAAMIICIAGAGLLINRFAFKKDKQNDIAQVNDVSVKHKEEPTIGLPKPVATAKSSELAPSGLLLDSITDKSTATLSKKSGARKDVSLSTRNDEKDDDAALLTAKPVTTDNAHVEAEAQSKTENKKENIVTAQDQSTSEAVAQNRSLDLSKQKAAAPGASGNATRQQPYKANNLFSGRVTDAQNNALPFANITNQADNIGTYSDAKGYFALTSPDTSMQVEVRSVGFTNSQIQLRNASTTPSSSNQIILKEDHSSLAEVTISQVKRNSSRARENNNNMILDDAEPADGWNKYDLYLANNLQIPEKFETKQKNTNGEVELSFDVDKSGAPINITVVRSLCESCDKEAIRLLREGPKWKKKKKKGRVTVGF